MIFEYLDRILNSLRTHFFQKNGQCKKNFKYHTNVYSTRNSVSSWVKIESLLRSLHLYC
jgi:hypothetical protein